jgi:aryl-alcohol dehydrogenase-like predicted oxidoreductase
MIERQDFGRTGHNSSRVIFGAAGLGGVDQDTADSLLPLLDAHGVNHLDTAASYGDAELRLAPWLARRRDDFFVATKTGERSGEGARRQLEASLSRLGIESVDLIQLHNLVEEEEWEVAHGKGGVVKALVRARDEGLVKAIGVTGHGLRIPRMHLRSLERFDFDSVLFPYNYKLRSIEQFRIDSEALIATCAERGVAIQTIKSIARRRWPEPKPDDRLGWYKPIEDDAAIGRAVRYVLSRPGLFLNSASDFRLLHTVLSAAEGPLQAPSTEELESDSDELNMVALFDGGVLDRI